MRTRTYEYDIIRTIATLSVIVVHVSAMAIAAYQPLSFQSITMIWVNRLLKFTTPVFAYLAASMIHESYKSKSFEYIPFLSKRIKKIIVPYIIVSIVYYLLISYLSKSNLNLQVFLTKLITGSHQYHLYFIPIIIQLYLLTPVFLWLKEKIPMKYLLLAMFTINYLSVLYIKFSYSDRVFLKYFFPYLMGLYFGKDLILHLRNLGNKVWILLLLTFSSGVIYGYMWLSSNYSTSFVFDGQFILWLHDTSWLLYCTLSCLTLTWISSFFSDNKWIQEVTFSFSTKSYYVYLFHPLILTFNTMLMNKLSISSTTLRLIINLIVVIVSSTILASIITKTIHVRKVALRKLSC